MVTLRSIVSAVASAALLAQSSLGKPSFFDSVVLPRMFPLTRPCLHSLLDEAKPRQQCVAD